MSYVVPEQTVTIAEGASSALLSNSDSVSILTNGADAVLNVNGTVYNTTVFNDWRGIGVSVSINSTDEYAITTNGVVTGFRAVRHVDDGDGMSHDEGIPGNYTVSLFAPIPSAEPKWEESGCVINVSGRPGSTLTPDKTYSEVEEAINNGIIPVAIVAGGSIVLQYVGKTATALKFQNLAVNTSVGGTISGLVSIQGKYSEADGFTLEQFSVAF